MLPGEGLCIGILLKDQGDQAGAHSYLEESLAIIHEVLGDRHRDTTSSLNNLGVLLKDQGDLEGARTYLEETLAIAREVLGEGHIDTDQSLNNVGALLKAQGDLEERVFIMSKRWRSTGTCWATDTLTRPISSTIWYTPRGPGRCRQGSLRSRRGTGNL
jgi:tetratricopeptide (TPR) repeat protein